MKKEQIIKRVVRLVKKINRIPSMNEILEQGITVKTIEYHFQNLKNLFKECKEVDESAFAGFTDMDYFTKENFSKLETRVSKFSTYVVSSAVTGCKPHKKFLNAINTFNEKNKACLLVTPCSDPAKAGSNKWVINSEIPAESLVFQDLNLNSNLMISNIKMSAKQVLPLTGLGRHGGKPKSVIYASPKQFLEFKAVKNDPGALPRALMTSGSVTLADYATERYMSERLGYLANIDHTYGAVIVELDNQLGAENFFHFRQIQTNNSGAFIDLGTCYLPNGTTKPAKTSYLEVGDYHNEDVDPVAEAALIKMIKTLKPELIGVQDFNSFNVTSHHEKTQHITRAIRANNKQLDLAQVGKESREKLISLLKLGTHKILYKWGNHDDFLVRYLEEGRFIKDPVNYEISLKLALELCAGRNPLKLLYDLPKEYEDRIIWLNADSSHMIHDIEVGPHGHLGSNGKRSPPLSMLEGIYTKSITGDAHTPGIFRGSYRVGLLGKLKMGYNKGPSGWCQTSCVVYENGSRQLINIINGKWRA